MQKILSLALAFVMLFLSSCGGSAFDSSNSPKAIAQKFILSLQAKNLEEAKTYCTPETAKYLEFLMGMGAKITLLKEGETLDFSEYVEGDVAFVTNNKGGKNASEPVKLVKLNGIWKIDMAPK